MSHPIESSTFELEQHASLRLARAAAPGACRLVTAQSSAAVARLCAALDTAYDTVAQPQADAPADALAPTHRAEFARLVRAALAQAAADDTLLNPAQREGSAQCYRRHLLAADPDGRYAMAALVWQPGQASPVHAHHTWCAYAVLDGTLTESLFDWNSALGRATQARTQSRAAGAVSYTRAGLSCIHRLGNAGTRAAVSLHVYGVAGERIATHVNDLVNVDAPMSGACPALVEH
ncbi:MAG TPA: cysteine dioxygenase family protein, partial [Trinickia sp.]|nr:cysteine dioxygenase family protein [Trinickia sp.]